MLNIDNFILYWDDFLISLNETFQMMVVAGILTLTIGALIGVTIVVTQKDGILENKYINFIFEGFTNIIWAIPFFILYMMLYPLVSMVLGSKSFSVIGAIFPLVIGTVPFFARQVVSTLSEVNPGLIEAAQSMGQSNLQIVFRVYLKESIPGLSRGSAITLVTLFGLTTIAGSFGIGGIGIFVKRYGYDQNMYDILYISVFVIVVFVFIIQGIGNYIAKKTTH